MPTIGANSVLTFSLIGQREDLADVIFNIDPVDCPFSSTVSKTSATAVKHEWQKDNLAAANTSNAAIEGQVFTADTRAPTTRLSNTAQILLKEVEVSGTSDAVSLAGRSKQMVYEMAKSAKELNRDIEAVLLNNQAALAGNSSTARQLRGLPAWFSTNLFGGTGVTAGTNSTALVAGSDNLTLSEDLVNTAHQGCFTAGGNPDILLVHPSQRRVVSQFTGTNGTQKFVTADDKKLTATVSVYIGDFGTFKVVNSRFQRAKDAFLLQSDLWATAWLRKYQTIDIAKVGDSTRAMILAELTLEARQEAGSALITDLA